MESTAEVAEGNGGGWLAGEPPSVPGRGAIFVKATHSTGSGQAPRIPPWGVFEMIAEYYCLEMGAID
jgi:hypothetical protein